MYPLSILLACCGCLLAADAVDDRLTASDAEVRTVVETMFAGGLPDTRGATFYREALSVHLADGRTIGAHHLHARLADGRWILNLDQRPSWLPADAYVDEPTMPGISGTVTDVTGEQPCPLPSNDEQSGLSAPDRDLLSRAWSDPARRLSLGSWTPWMALLDRAGVTGCVQAVPWEIEPIAGYPANRAMVTLLVDGYRLANLAHGGPLWLTATDCQQPARLMPPAIMLRKRWAAWCLSSCIIGDQGPLVPLLTPAAALQLAQRLMEPINDPIDQEQWELHRQWVAADPRSANVASDTGGTLRRWAADLSVFDHNDVAGGRDASRMTGLDIGDVPALLALLDDPRPSAWVDDGWGASVTRIRTIGDQAWRSLAWLTACDPRHLVGRDPCAPWTAAERGACAADLRAWYAAQVTHGPGGLLAAVDAADLPIDVQAFRVLAATDPVRRARLIERMRTCLHRTGPDIDADALAQALGAMNADDAIVAEWPVRGATRTPLALWHDRHGRPQHLDAVFDDLLRGATARLPDLARGCEMILRIPSQPRLHRLTKLLAAGTADPSARRLIQHLLQSQSAICAYHNDGLDALQRYSLDTPSRDEVMGQTLAALLLHDERPAPPDWLIPDERGMPGGFPMKYGIMRPERFTDWRICDLAAWVGITSQVAVCCHRDGDLVKSVDGDSFPSLGDAAARSQWIGDYLAVMQPALVMRLERNGLPTSAVWPVIPDAATP